MSNEALSQNEIDALLTQTQGKSANVQKEKAVFTYNFRKQKKFNKSNFVLLESIHKRFLRNIEVTLTNVLSSPIMSSLAAATELSYSDCMDSFSSPTCIYTLNVNNGLGKFLLEIDPNFAFFVIDKILGGNSKEITTMDRELSLIEERVMNRVVKFLIEDLINAWERVEKLDIKVDGFYAQPDYVQTLSSTETVILISMDVRGTDKTLGYINLCLPSSILESLVLKYDNVSDSNRLVVQSSKERNDLKNNVMQSELSLRAVLGHTKMNVNDLLNLDQGDVISLHSEAKNPVDIFIGDLKIYKAFPIKKDNSLAVKISEFAQNNDEAKTQLSEP